MKKDHLFSGWKKVHPYLKGLVVIWLIFTIFSSLIHQVPEKIPAIKTYTVIIKKWENNFKPIKETLPFELGIIGYLNDADIEKNRGNGDTAAEYVLTQFVMSPTIIEQGENHEWVLLNMSKNNLNTWLKNKSGEYEITSYSFNLYLAHKTR